MVMPNLKDIFYNNDFTDDVPQELAEAQNESHGAIEQLVKKYNIVFDDENDLETAHGKELLATHCLGFEQGFRWAVYLLTGIRSDEEACSQ